MTVPAATATAGTASHSVQRRTLRRRERLGAGCLRSLPCGRCCCWCLAARVGVIGGAAIAAACYSNPWPEADFGPSADVAAAEQVALGEVVPVAAGADLDHVAGHLIHGAVQVGEAVAGPDAAVGLAQGVPEDVGDVDQRLGGADRAGGGGLLADVAGGPQQLGVGVADLVARQPAAAELGELRPLGQGVVDEPHLGASVPGTPGGSRLGNAS